MTGPCVTTGSDELTGHLAHWTGYTTMKRRP